MVLKSLVPPLHVVPVSVFEANVLVNTDRHEPHRLVESDACGVWKGDTRKYVIEPLKTQNFEQRCVESSGDSVSLILLTNVHRAIDGPLVRFPRPVWSGIRVSEDGPLTFANDPWKIWMIALDPVAHLLGRRGIELE